MKITATIVLTLVCFGLLGQPSEWDREVIVKNKVKDVLVYTRVPKTNPDYFKEPIGLMLISETNFDKSGQVIRTNCKNCYYISDTDGDCCCAHRSAVPLRREESSILTWSRIAPA